MFCTRCGTQLPEGAKFCSSCGAPVEIKAASTEAAQTGAPAAAKPAQRTSGLAIASLVCGITGLFLGWILFVVPPILAIIFSLVTLPQFSRDPALKGKGMAIAGLVLGIVGLGWLILAAGWFTWAFWGLFGTL